MLCFVSGNINVRAAFIHVIGDTIQSVGVLVAACIINYKARKLQFFPLCSGQCTDMCLRGQIHVPVTRETLDTILIPEKKNKVQDLHLLMPHTF